MYISFKKRQTFHFNYFLLTGKDKDVQKLKEMKVNVTKVKKMILFFSLKNSF